MHLDYLEAGASIIITASYQVIVLSLLCFYVYQTNRFFILLNRKKEKKGNIVLYVRQATIQGFEAKGLSREEAEALLRRSVEIACEARDIYHERCAKGTCLEQRPILVAASVGSYGAYLADGSEYR